MKDNQALTLQWFSVKQARKKEEGLEELGEFTVIDKLVERVKSELNSNQLTVQRSLRNRRKLKRGSHRMNQFAIRLRELSGKPDALVERIERIASEGVPNYFGEQRFGRKQDNVAKAQQLFNETLEHKGALSAWHIYIGCTGLFVQSGTIETC